MIYENQENVFKIKSFTDKDGEHFIYGLAEFVHNDDGTVDLNTYAIEDGEQVLKFKHLNVVPTAIKETELSIDQITETSVTFTINEWRDKENVN